MLMLPLRAGLIALSFLWPFTSGPLANVQPYLVSMLLAGMLLAIWPRRAPEQVPAFAAAGWLAAALISSGIAVLQYFDWEARFYPWVNIAAPGHAFGNLRQPNQLASLLVIGLASLAWMWRTARLRAPVAASLAVPLLAALAATASRVGLVELVVVGALALGWALRQRQAVRLTAWAAGVALALYLAATLLLPVLLDAVSGVGSANVLERISDDQHTCGSRLVLWRNVLHLIALKPWLGWGWGELSYAHYMTLYPGERFCYILDNAHNLPLHLAVELGLPVALLVCVTAAWAVLRARPWREADPARQLAWSVLAILAVHSAVEYPLWYGPFQISAALAVVMLLQRHPLGARHSDAAAAGAAWTGPALCYALSAALFAAVTYAAWDYQRISLLYGPPGAISTSSGRDPLEQARQSWLFGDVVRFAEVTMHPPTRANAAWMLPDALATLHFSPETRVITRVIESATWLGQDELALAHLARFKAAFPKEHRRWFQDRVAAGKQPE